MDFSQRQIRQQDAHYAESLNSYICYTRSNEGLFWSSTYIVRSIYSTFALNRPPEKRFDDLIVHLISGRFDNNIRRQWEASIGFNEFPDWEKLKMFLTNNAKSWKLSHYRLPKKQGKPISLPESHFLNKVSH